MSYESAVMAWHRAREESQGDPELQQRVEQFGMEIGMARVRDIFHAGFITEYVIANARVGRSFDGRMLNQQ